MNLSKNYLPADMPQALELHRCMLSVLERARMEVSLGNLDQVDKWIYEYKRCKRDIDKLRFAKQTNDELQAFARQMEEKGLEVGDLAKSYKGNKVDESVAGASTL